MISTKQKEKLCTKGKSSNWGLGFTKEQGQSAERVLEDLTKKARNKPSIEDKKMMKTIVDYNYLFVEEKKRILLLLQPWGSWFAYFCLW